MDDSSGDFSVLSLDTMWLILGFLLRVRDFLSFSQVNREIHNTTLSFLRMSPIRLEEELQFDQLKRLPFSQVLSPIQVCNSSDIRRVSSRMRGTLIISREPFEQSSEEASSFTLESLQTLFLRSHLYPASSFHARTLTSTKVPLNIGWNPVRRHLDMELTSFESRKIGGLIRRICLLPIISLRLSYMKESITKNIGIDSIVDIIHPLSNLALTTFIFPDLDFSLVLGYIHQRERRGEPIVLSSLEFSSPLSCALLTNVLDRFVHKPIPSVRSISGISLSDNLDPIPSLRVYFPNLQRLTLATFPGFCRRENKLRKKYSGDSSLEISGF